MIDLTNLIAILPEILPTIYEYIKSKGGLIKSKGDLKEIAKQQDFQKVFLEDSDNNLIIYADGDIYLGDISKIPKKVEQELLTGLTIDEKERPKKDVNFFTVDFYQRVKKFTSTQINNEDFNKYLKYIKSNEIKNLFHMSAYVKSLFDEGNTSEANIVRSDIGRHYGKSGRKFRNLYNTGYLHSVLDYSITRYGDETQEFKNNFESEIKHFLEHSDTIFFVYRDMNKKEIILKCNFFISREEPFIALHAANKENITAAKKILSELREYAIDHGYNIKAENIESKQKTPLIDIFITKFPE